MPRRYEIPSTPHNMVWGYLDSSTPHILEVNSGDTVTLHSFPSGGKETLPDDINMVPSDYLAALETLPPGPGSHFITGPIYVRGAAVGDALQIDILDVKVRQDWGFVSILPLLLRGFHSRRSATGVRSSKPSHSRRLPSCSIGATA